MTMEQKKNNQTTINVNTKANLIWSIADIIGQGLYKPHEYGKVILPMTVIKRFDDVLLPTKDKVLEAYENTNILRSMMDFYEKRQVTSFIMSVRLRLIVYYQILNISRKTLGVILQGTLKMYKIF